MLQWCVPARRQHAGSVDSESEANAAGPMSEIQNKPNSSSARIRRTPEYNSVSRLCSKLQKQADQAGYCYSEVPCLPIPEIKPGTIGSTNAKPFSVPRCGRSAPRLLRKPHPPPNRYLQDPRLSREESGIEMERTGLGPKQRLIIGAIGIEQHIGLFADDH